MKTLAKLISRVARPVTGARGDYDPLLDLVGEARFVLLGAQTHGTHEFYRARAQITRRLICERGFCAVAVEADWPDAYRVNRFVRGQSDDPESVDALAGFVSFPTWLLRNADVVDFIGWLKSHNHAAPSAREQAGFYGLDLYSLHKSIEAVIAYLDEANPAAAKEARVRYGCFDHFGEGARRYGFAAKLGLAKSCEDEAVKELIDLRRRQAELLKQDGPAAEEAYFSAAQNALLVENAERYYRAMFSEQTTAWNQRDGHMMEMLTGLAAHFQNQPPPGKIVVWSHNLHVGDSRAIKTGQGVRISLGQLMRTRYGKEAVLVGFTTDSGTVTAAADWWDSPPRRAVLKPSLEGSYETVFHRAEHRAFFLNLRDANAATAALIEPRLERAIGVVYRAESERDSHYFQASLPHQFDAVIHFDETRAVEPIEHTTEWDKGEVPETFPTGV